MRYWPLSLIVTSPMMPARFVPELEQITQVGLSRPAYHACFEVAERTQPVEAPNLVIVSHVGTPDRRIYTEYPGLDQWLRLERCGIMERDGERFIMMDALH